jgi:hypothetical protein
VIQQFFSQLNAAAKAVIIVLYALLVVSLATRASALNRSLRRIQERIVQLEEAIIDDPRPNKLERLLRAIESTTDEVLSRINYGEQISRDHAIAAWIHEKYIDPRNNRAFHVVRVKNNMQAAAVDISVRFRFPDTGNCSGPQVAEAIEPGGYKDFDIVITDERDSPFRIEVEYMDSEHRAWRLRNGKCELTAVDSDADELQDHDPGAAHNTDREPK